MSKTCKYDKVIVKKFYNFFGPLLMVLLTLYIVLSIFLLTYFNFNSYCPYIRHINSLGVEDRSIPVPTPPWHMNISFFIGNHMGTFTLIIFIVSLVYFIVGCSSYFYNRFGHKEKRRNASGKYFLLRGGLGMGIVYILYIILQLIADVYGIC